MKERSVSERRAGWSFGRRNVLFGLGALSWDLDANIPLGLRQVANLELEVAASHGSTLENRGSDQEPCAKTPPSVVACAKRHLVSNLFALGARVVVASRLTIVSPCGARREGAPRKLLGATCGRRAPLPCFQLSCLGGTPLPLRMKLAIDKVQRGEKPPPAAKIGGEGLPAGGPWL